MEKWSLVMTILVAILVTLMVLMSLLTKRYGVWGDRS